MIGVLDHEVDIERKLRVFVHKIDDCRAEGNVVHEMAIHDIAMDPVRAGLFNGMNFIGKFGKIGGKNGGRDDRFRHGVME